MTKSDIRPDVKWVVSLAGYVWVIILTLSLQRVQQIRQNIFQGKQKETNTPLTFLKRLTCSATSGPAFSMAGRFLGLPPEICNSLQWPFHPKFTGLISKRFPEY